MEEFFQKIEKLEELENEIRDKMFKLIFDAELDIAYESLKELTKKIQKEEGITEKEANIKAEQLINSIVFEKTKE